MRTSFLQLAQPFVCTELSVPKRNVLNVLGHAGCGTPTLTESDAVKGRGCIGGGMLNHPLRCMLVVGSALDFVAATICLHASAAGFRR